MKAVIDEDRCIACGTCESLCPSVFKVEDGVAKVISDESTECDVKDVAQSCPAGAISVEE